MSESPTPALSLRAEWRRLAAIAAVFAAFFWLPVGTRRFDGAVTEALELTRWYAREHVILCLVPAFFIAGAIGVFVSHASVMRYLGARAPALLAYGVASVSGTVLAVCSCTVLPLFAGIWRMGAGLGPATAFLYSGPAISVLAVVLTARVLGLELGIARAVGAVLFSIAIGGAMHLIFRREEAQRARTALAQPLPDGGRPLWQNALHLGAWSGILVFANWSTEGSPGGVFAAVAAAKWWITAGFAVGLGVILVRWFDLRARHVLLVGAATAGLALRFPGAPMMAFLAGAVGLSLLMARRTDETGRWFAATWSFARQILPLLFVGVLVSGFLLGRPGREGAIPGHWVEAALGGNSLRANLAASVVGALMYFATLTEIPILQGLLGAGMGKGPALALLLAGPSLSLPSLLVLRSVMGGRRTLVYVGLVVVMATLAGSLYGAVAS